MTQAQPLSKLNGIQSWCAGRVQLITTVAVFGVTFAFSFGTDQHPMTLFANVVLSCLGAATSWLSFRNPRVSLGAVAVLCAGSPAFTTSFAALELMVVFVLFQVVLRSDVDPRVVGAIGFVSLTVNDLWLRRATNVAFSGPTTLYPLVLTALAVGLGYQGRQMRQQHAQLVALQTADRERAILSERQRIARDLHDVAAHHLSALVVQNKLARRVGTTESLQEAADFSALTARQALDALRQVVGVLSSESPLEPQPTIADLGPMFDRLAGAGLVVHRSDSNWYAGAGQLRRDVELAIVRITQEALTNVLRHRGPGNAWFDVSVVDGHVQLTIENDGVVEEPPSRDNVRRERYGLINMAERAKSTGGSFDIDTSPHGGWRVRATLPYGVSS